MNVDLPVWKHDEYFETTWGELVELKYGKGLKEYKGAVGEFPVYGTNGPVGFCDKPLCNFPSIIIGRKGAYRGVHYSNTPFYVIDTAYFVVPKYDINLKWAYYSLLTQDINGLDSGSAIPSTRREDFYAMVVTVPPRFEQDKIVENLDCLNQKIELNRQTNQTLEKIAQALFKSWFVDFDPVKAKVAAKQAGGNAEQIERAAMAAISSKTETELDQLAPEQTQNLKTTAALFPDELVDSELGEIPASWFVKTIGDVTSLVIDHRGKTPKKLGGDWSDSGNPALSAKNIKKGRVVNHESIRFLDDEIYSKWMKVQLEVGDVLLTSEAPMGEMFFLTNDTKYCLSQRLYALRALEFN